MPKRGSRFQYLSQIWTIVIFRMLIDAAAALFLVAVTGLLAAGLVLLSSSAVGVTQQHIRAASAILGFIYLLVIFVRTLYRHWILSGQALPAKMAASSADAKPARAEELTDPVEVAPEYVGEEDAERSTSSN